MRLRCEELRRRLRPLLGAWLLATSAGILALPGFLVSRPLLAGPDAPVRVYVDVERGDDGPDRDGSFPLPFRSVQRGLARAEEVAQSKPPGLHVVLVLRGGSYGADETFPLRIPDSVASLSLVGEPVESRDAVIECTSTAASVFELVAGASSALTHLSAEGVSVRGGRRGLSAIALEGHAINVLVEACVFEEQTASSVEVAAGAGSTADARISSVTFRGSSGGVMGETGRGANLFLAVEESRFEHLRAYGPGWVLGAGVDIHADPLARVRAAVTMNRFAGTASAVQITASEPETDTELSGAWLDVVVQGNLIADRIETGAPGEGGPPDSSTCVPRSAVYLSVWPHHEVELLVASNTLYGLRGPAIYHDNLPALRALEETIPLVFVNNICWGSDAPSEFDFESAGEEVPGPRRTIAHNCLQHSALAHEGIDGNTAEDPLLVDPGGGDFRPRGGSPVTDRGLPGYSEGIDVDLDGFCRRTTQVCDLALDAYVIDIGAYELPGFCDADPRLFRRGDCNSSGGDLEISDPILVFSFLFLGLAAPSHLDPCDSNDDGTLDIADGIFLLAYLFLGGPPPEPPYPDPGVDPTRDCLDDGR